MSSYSFRTDQLCMYYQFEFLQKGFQVKYDKDQNCTKQYFPYSNILTVRLDYLYEDKLHALLLLLRDGIKYTYCMKCQGDAEKAYEQIKEHMNN